MLVSVISIKLIEIYEEAVSPMTLQLGDVAPDFEADTTEGRISFHDWIGDSWGTWRRPSPSSTLGA
jgi:hypothetical protein